MTVAIRKLLPVALIALISGLVFIPFLGALPLFDWDEVNFAEAAREMIITGEYFRIYIDYAPFWEKPPMFFWMQAMSMHLWGIGEFAARFPNAICGVVTLCLLYFIGRKEIDHRFGILWVLAYGGSILPHLYFRSGIIDPWFNLFIFLSLYCFLDVDGRQRKASIALGGMLLGFAVLTKGPVAYFIVAVVVGIFHVFRRRQIGLALKSFIAFSVIAALTFGIWYGVETRQHGTWFVREFTRYQVELLLKPGAGHSGFPGYHVVVLLLGCFPASIFAIRPLFKADKGNITHASIILWMRILVIVVVVLFSLVQSKIVHYSSLCYFPITFLATSYVWRLKDRGEGVGKWQRSGIVFIGFLYVLAGMAIVVIGINPDILSTIGDIDQNTLASMDMNIGWRWWHVVPVLFILAGICSLFLVRKTMTAVSMLYVFTAVFVYAGLACWVGKVQQYSQGPATEFFQSLAGKDVYVIPWGHKSYSQYWDFRKPPPDDFFKSQKSDRSDAYSKFSDPEYLLTAPDVDKDVYVITRVSKAGEFQSRYAGIEKIGSKGGFAFFVKPLTQLR